MAYRYRVETTAAATIREVWLIHSHRGPLTPTQVSALLERDARRPADIDVTCLEAQTTVEEAPRELVAVRYLGGVAPAVTKT